MLTYLLSLRIRISRAGRCSFRIRLENHCYRSGRFSPKGTGSSEQIPPKVPDASQWGFNPRLEFLLDPPGRYSSPPSAEIRSSFPPKLPGMLLQLPPKLPVAEFQFFARLGAGLLATSFRSPPTPMFSAWPRSRIRSSSSTSFSTRARSRAFRCLRTRC